MDRKTGLPTSVTPARLEVTPPRAEVTAAHGHTKMGDLIGERGAARGKRQAEQLVPVDATLRGIPEVTPPRAAVATPRAKDLVEIEHVKDRAETIKLSYVDPLPATTASPEAKSYELKFRAEGGQSNVGPASLLDLGKQLSQKQARSKASRDYGGASAKAYRQTVQSLDAKRKMADSDADIAAELYARSTGDEKLRIPASTANLGVADKSQAPLYDNRIRLEDKLLELADLVGIDAGDRARFTAAVRTLVERDFLTVSGVRPDEAKTILEDVPSALRPKHYTKRTAPIDSDLLRKAHQILNAARAMRKRGEEITPELRERIRAANRIVKADQRLRTATIG